MATLFNSYIGIDYSGADLPIKRLPGLQVFRAHQNTTPQPMHSPFGKKRKWNRKEIAYLCLELLKKDSPIIIGIDHNFSFPLSYMKRHHIENWDHFLDDLSRHWPTEKENVTVESCRKNNQRSGDPSEFRLTEKWTAGAKSVFRFDIQGAVAKSSHAGIPWLRFLRLHPDLKGKVHFWPFDGFKIPRGKSVLAEVYPAILKRRFESGYTTDAHDAYCIAKWLQCADSNGFLKRYFSPLLTEAEKSIVALEGWILGIY
ncbi:MAG: hypothetical protein PVI90_15620 [Desulfobacteraceae bacterium]|jgi:hypothetical protein